MMGSVQFHCSVFDRNDLSLEINTSKSCGNYKKINKCVRQTKNYFILIILTNNIDFIKEYLGQTRF